MSLLCLAKDKGPLLGWPRCHPGSHLGPIELARQSLRPPAERGAENAVHLNFVIDFVQPGCTIQVLPVLAAPSEGLRPQSNPLLFVQSGCTNSGLRRPKAFVCPRVHTGLVAVSILLELCPWSINFVFCSLLVKLFLAVVVVRFEFSQALSGLGRRRRIDACLHQIRNLSS